MTGLALVIGLWACNGGNSSSPETLDTRTSGTIHISADESFKPVIDSEIAVFEALHPGAHIIAHYKPEADCFRDLGVDSIRCIIATRSYSKEERAFVIDSLKTQPDFSIVAYDAVAVIVNPHSSDTTFTIPELQQLLTGKSNKKLQPVFDGLKSTSTVRFILDSVLKGQSLGANVAAEPSSKDVIDYVAANQDAIGFLGVSWVGNRQDSTQLSYLDKVKVVAIQDLKDTTHFVTPAQYNIYFKRYPLRRDLVCILKERHNGLGHGFSNFLSTQSGQLIFNRAFLMPAMMNFQVRSTQVNE
jgi:phosphate transport system substrate-binding protein